MSTLILLKILGNFFNYFNKSINIILPNKSPTAFTIARQKLWGFGRYFHHFVTDIISLLKIIENSDYFDIHTMLSVIIKK